MSLRISRSARRSLPLALLAVVVLGALAGCLGGVMPGLSSDGPSDPTPNATFESPPDGAALDSRSANETAGNLSVHFIDVGQGSAILVVGPSGETLLYDTGNWNDDGEHVLDYLRAAGVTRIDYLVTSHADADHVGGHAAVIDYYETEADGIGAIYDPGIASGTRTYERYLDAVETHDVTLYRAQAGDRIPMANASVEILGPPEGYLAGRDRNENSLVLRIQRGNASFLLPGDAEGQAEEYLTETYGPALNATVLAAGHHGSNTSTGPALLAAVEPRAVAVQSAYDSPYGHPHRELLGRLADRGIPTYWNGVHGTVVFETDGERVTVSTQRAAPTAPFELRGAPGVEPGADGDVELRATFAAGGRPAPVAADGGETKTGADPPLTVAEVHADARGDDGENLNDEYVVFRNEGDRALDLSGWTVEDEAGHAYTFPAGTTLAPGERLRLHTGSGTDREGHYYWGSGRPVWNNAGDTVFVRTDEGRLVTEVTYDG